MFASCIRRLRSSKTQEHLFGGLALFLRHQRWRRLRKTHVKTGSWRSFEIEWFKKKHVNTHHHYSGRMFQLLDRSHHWPAVKRCFASELHFTPFVLLRFPFGRMALAFHNNGIQFPPWQRRTGGDRREGNLEVGEVAENTTLIIYFPARVLIVRV